MVTLVKTSQAEIGISDAYRLCRGLFEPEYFKNVTRPLLYEKAKGDPELVHDLTLELLHKYPSVVKLFSLFLNVPDQKLRVVINGKEVVDCKNI